MWVDLLISAPVTVFLLWLYWYSADASRPRWIRRTDACLLALAPLAAIAIIVAGHAHIDYPGMGLNVMLVACAYVVLITLLGVGWLLRWMPRAKR